MDRDLAKGKLSAYFAECTFCEVPAGESLAGRQLIKLGKVPNYAKIGGKD